MQHVMIIGAGVGGLTSAIRLAQHGCRVTVVEARDRPGGLAASFEIEGFQFDAGPYILLDRLGLEWAFRQVGLDIELRSLQHPAVDAAGIRPTPVRLDIARVSLQRIAEVYETDVDGQPLCVFDSLDKTAAGIESRWPGNGKLYRQFIAQMQVRYARLQPLQCLARPKFLDLVRTGAWRDIPYLLRSLDSVMAGSRLPPSVAAALGIWTHVAGQTMKNAPSPLALVPAVIHSVGAYYPQGGIGAIPETLFDEAQKQGVNFRFNTMVNHVRCHGRVASGVELSDGEFLTADAIVSNIGLGTYRQLLDQDGRNAIPSRTYQMLERLPLQSPGICVYLAVKGEMEPPYLRFHMHNEPDGCRLLVTPAVLDSTLIRDGWSPVRLIAPLNHQRAETGGETQQRAFLSRVLKEERWRKRFREFRVLATRIPQEWGSTYHLFQNSMNPVMTAEFMRAGRLAHRSPWIRGLYLTGSATHPGQWVSFCAVSGILTADRVLEDFTG